MSTIRLDPVAVARRLFQAARGVVVSAKNPDDQHRKFGYLEVHSLPNQSMTHVEDFSQPYGLSRRLHPEMDDQQSGGGQSGGGSSNDNLGDGSGTDQKKSAEHIIIYLNGGDMSTPIIIATPDRRYYLYGKKSSSGGGGGGSGGSSGQMEDDLKEGEFAIHDDQGHQVHFTRGGIVTSVPYDKTATHRIMKNKAGTPDKPTNTPLANNSDAKAHHTFEYNNAGMKTVLTQGTPPESQKSFDDDSQMTSLARVDDVAVAHHVIIQDLQGNVLYSRRAHAGGEDTTMVGTKNMTIGQDHNSSTGGDDSTSVGGDLTHHADGLAQYLSEDNVLVNPPDKKQRRANILTTAGAHPKARGRP